MTSPGQLTLFPALEIVEHPRARITDPVTSHQAAASARDLAATHDRIILEVLRRRARPMAAEEISDALAGAVSALQVARRTACLERAGLIERTEELHTNRSGRQAHRWRAVAPVVTTPAAPRHRPADDRPGDCGPPPTPRQRRWRR